MSDREQILQQALSLPPADRAFVAAALGESLADAGGNSAAELLAELRRRSVAYRNGDTTSRPAADVIADQRRRQAEGA